MSEDHKLTEEELEAREADRVAKLAAGSRAKMAVQNILKPDLKAIRRQPSDHGTSSSPKPHNPPHVNSALSTEKKVVDTSPQPVRAHSKNVSSGGVPEWKRIQQEKEQAERERLVAEARAREQAAKQIQARVATTGLTVNIVDEITPEYLSPRSANREVVNPNATPDQVSKVEEKRYERQESFDPRNVPDFVSRPDEKRYERQETFDPRHVPDFVSKPDHDYYKPEKSFYPSATPNYVTKPTHSYGADTDSSTPSAAKYCPWCGAFAGGGKFCASCGKEVMPSASGATSPRGAPTGAYQPAPAPYVAPQRVEPRNEPFIAPASTTSKGSKSYSNFSAGGLVAVEGGNEFPVTNFGCDVHEINVRLIENGKRIQVTRSVMENGAERKDQQNFNLPYQVTLSTLSARYNPREANGTLRVKFLRPSANGTPIRGDHEIVRFVVPGQPGSSQQRVAIGIDQNNDYYKFTPGPASPYDTTFTAVLVGGTLLEFRSSFAIPEGDAIKSVSGKQSVNLPKAPLLEQIKVEGNNIFIYHQIPANVGGAEQNVPEANVHIQLL